MKPKIWKVINPDHVKGELHFAFLNKEEICATDGYAMIIHKTSEIFSQEFVSQIPEGNWLIPYDCLKEMNKNSRHYINDKNQIVIPSKEKEKAFDLLNGDNFPGYKEVIPDPNYNVKDELNSIGLNPRLLDNLREAIDPDCSEVKLYFNDFTRPFLVRGMRYTDFENYTAILMPAIEE